MVQTIFNPAGCQTEDFRVTKSLHFKILLQYEHYQLSQGGENCRTLWISENKSTGISGVISDQWKGIIRPVAGQGSSPETRFSFLKHFRILYPFIANTIQINQRLCNNWQSKDLTQKNSKSVTLTLMSCTEIGLVQNKILDKALSSCHNWIKSIEGFAKKLKL